MLNSLMCTDADMRLFFYYFCSRVSSDVGIWTQVAYVSEYASSALVLQHKSLNYPRISKCKGAMCLQNIGSEGAKLLSLFVAVE